MRKENRFITNAITIPTVVSIILAIPKAKGFPSFPCVTVMQRKTTHIRKVPFSCFIRTDKLIMGISKTDNKRHRNTSYVTLSAFFNFCFLLLTKPALSLKNPSAILHLKQKRQNQISDTKTDNPFQEPI